MTSSKPRSLLDLDLRKKIIPYHTIPRARIRAHTESQLAQCSLPDSAWGPCGAVTTLSGSLRLSAYARELLPAGVGGTASASLEGFSPGTRKSFTGSTDSLRRRLEGSMHLEEFATPAPDAKSGTSGKTKPTAKSSGTVRGDGVGGEGGGSSERGSEREVNEAGRPSLGVADSTRLAEQVTLTEGVTATGLIRSLWEQYPLITSAMREMQGLSEPTVLSDFPTLTLVEAAYAARLQAHGYTILKESAMAGAPAAGAAGVEAATALDSQFDFNASEAIIREQIILDISPLEATLGVLPLLQIGLHFWYQLHSEQTAAGSEVLKAATRINLSPGGRFDPRKGLTSFRAAWASAAGEKAVLPHHEIYCALIRSIAAAPSTDTAKVDGKRLCWDTYRMQVLTDHADHSLEERYTAAELTTLRRGMVDFALAHATERDVVARQATAAVNYLGYDVGSSPDDDDAPSVCSIVDAPAVPPPPPPSTGADAILAAFATFTVSQVRATVTEMQEQAKATRRGRRARPNTTAADSANVPVASATPGCRAPPPPGGAVAHQAAPAALAKPRVVAVAPVIAPLPAASATTGRHAPATEVVRSATPAAPVALAQPRPVSSTSVATKTPDASAPPGRRAPPTSVEPVALHAAPAALAQPRPATIPSGVTHPPVASAPPGRRATPSPGTAAAPKPAHAARPKPGPAHAAPPARQPSAPDVAPGPCDLGGAGCPPRTGRSLHRV